MLVAAITAAIVLLPLIGLCLSDPGRVDPIVRSAPAATPWGIIVASVLYPLGIGGLATLLAWPVAWVARGASRALLALFIVPIALPSYLAYSGWMLLIAPDTSLGGMVGRAEPWVSIVVTRGLAVWGLALWSFPLAAMVLASGMRAIPQSTLDAMALERPGPWRRASMVAGMMRGTVAASVGLVSLLMLASAIPLHLAQIPTVAITVWTDLSLGASAGEAWLRAWPALAAAAIGAAAIVWRLARRAELTPAMDLASRPARASWIGAAMVWLAAVLVPLVLYFLSLREWASLGRFWRLSGAATIDSLVVAGCTGAVVAILALAAWCALTCRAVMRPWVRTSIGLVTALWVMVGLAPGVLIGAAVRAWWNQPWLGWFGDAVDRSPALLVLGQAARFGFLGLIAAWLLASGEPRALRDTRRLHGADRLSDWWRLIVRPSLGALVGVGLLAMVLSLHEIESTVILAPAGRRVLAQQVLEHLHYNYVEEMSAASVNLLVGTVLAAWAAIGLAIPGRSGRAGTP